MNDNKDIEKASRTVFDKFRIDAPDNAWDKLDADLDKKQAVVYKQRANRFKRLSIVLLLFIFSFTIWHYLIPSSTTNNLRNVITEEKALSDKTSSNNIAAENPSTSILQNAKLIPAKNKIVPASSKINNNNLQLNTLQNAQLASEVKPFIKQINKYLMQDEKQNNTDEFINLHAENSKNIAESNSAIGNIISNEFENVLSDSGIPNTTDHNSLAIIIADNTVSTITDSNKSEPVYFAKNDSLFKQDLQSKSHLSLAVFYSPNQSWSILKDNTNDNIDDVAMYNNRENSNFSFSTGINLKYDLSSKWSLITGANYSPITKSATVETMYAEANDANEIHFLLPTSNGVIEMPLDDNHPNLLPGDSLNAKLICNQTIKFITVPLMVRFQLTKKKFIYYFNGGFSMNFIVQEKMKINMNNSEMTIINHINGLKKMNYSFLIGAGVQYNLYNDFGIFIEPMFKGSFTSITHNTNVNSYPFSLGLDLGFSMHF